METAKVDIRKLQILNDRINQCIDALNQVRMSVHGLSHTGQAYPFVSQGINPLTQAPLGYGGVGSMGFAPYLPGVSHSSPVVASPAFLPGLTQGISTFAGLSHTSPEEAFARPAWADPLLAFRIAQTFPYAQYPFPAVVPIF
jgi:hypothetical protein